MRQLNIFHCLILCAFCTLSNAQVVRRTANFTNGESTLSLRDSVRIFATDFNSGYYQGTAHFWVHEDFVNGTELAQQIKKYGFFSYSANEALHLSPSEEKQMESIVENIVIEYHNNQDAFSKDIIISHLTTLLKYANRFYERQFINRQEMSIDLLEQFNQQLEEYYQSGQLQENGAPSIEEIADKMSITQRYLSDTLKEETGKTTTEHIQLFLINEAKDLLLAPNASISETAYQLGFEYPQYFSRLFKKKVGVTPKEFIENHSMN